MTGQHLAGTRAGAHVSRISMCAVVSNARLAFHVNHAYSITTYTVGFNARLAFYVYHAYIMACVAW